jgi:DNA-directed RNA polymerase alpha subunit
METKQLFEKLTLLELLEIKDELESIIVGRTAITIIDDLDISIRCYELLKSNGIKHLEQLTTYTKEECINWKGASPNTIKEISEELNIRSLSFRKVCFNCKKNNNCFKKDTYPEPHDYNCFVK